MGSQEVIKIEDDFILIRFQNDENEPFHVEKQISQGLIQFHFGIKGKRNLFLIKAITPWI